jgi:hypothetical protein
MQSESKSDSSQFSSGNQTTANRKTLPRGRPAFADSQREQVLQALRAGGIEGVSRATLIFEKRITQCGARVDELKRMGYDIASESREGERYIRYVLKAEPETPQPLPTYKQRDFLVGQRKTGLPLFDSAVPE